MILSIMKIIPPCGFSGRVLGTPRGFLDHISRLAGLICIQPMSPQRTSRCRWTNERAPGSTWSRTVFLSKSRHITLKIIAFVELVKKFFCQETNSLNSYSKPQREFWMNALFHTPVKGILGQETVDSLTENSWSFQKKVVVSTYPHYMKFISKSIDFWGRIYLYNERNKIVILTFALFWVLKYEIVTITSVSLIFFLSQQSFLE